METMRRVSMTTTATLTIAILALILSACGTGDPADVGGGGATDATTGAEGEEGTTPEDVETISLRVTNWLSPPSALGETLEWWASEVEERSDGRVEIERFYDASLLAATEHVPGIGDGRADLGLASGAYHPGEMPLSNIAGIPFVSSDAEAVARAFTYMYENNDAFRDEWASQNLHVLSFHPNTAVATGLVDPIDSLTAFDGLRIRSVGHGARALEDLGADPVSMPAEDVYEALQRGTIDAWSGFPFDAAAASGLGEVAPHVFDLRLGVFSQASQPAINLDVWEDLPEDVQQLMNDVSADFLVEAVQIQMDAEEEACDTFLEEGGSVTVADEQEVAEWGEGLQENLMTRWLDDAVEAGVDRADAEEFRDEYLDAVTRFEEEGTEYVDGMKACADR